MGLPIGFTLTVYGALFGLIIVIVVVAIIFRNAKDIDFGWSILVKKYEMDKSLPENIISIGGGKVDQRMVSVGGNSKGLVLANPCFPTVLIPWEDIKIVPASYFGFKSYDIEARNAPEVTISINANREKDLIKLAEGNWSIIQNK